MKNGKQSLLNHMMAEYVSEVYSVIPFLFSALCVALLISSSNLSAQQATDTSQVAQELSQKTTQEQDIEPASDKLKTVTNAQKVETNQPGILRLEDTFRGNKEQPQVLTIVPWQLPIHQRINENREWQLQTKKLSSIERNAFLRNLAVVNELNRPQTKAIIKEDTVLDNN